MKQKTILTAALSILLLVGCSGQRSGELSSAKQAHTYEGHPIVYVMPEISSQGLLTAYEFLEAPAGEDTVIQLSNTETDAGFSWSGLTGELEQSLGETAVVMSGTETDFSSYERAIILSYFISHERVGFNGAVKQTAALSPALEKQAPWPDGQDGLKLLAETGKQGAEQFDGQLLYISVMDHLSMESAGVELPEDNTYDIGILASYDPVALDQACVDFVRMLEEGLPFSEHIETTDGIDTLTYAEELGLGSRTYALSIAEY